MVKSGAQARAVQTLRADSCRTGRSAPGAAIFISQNRMAASKRSSPNWFLRPGTTALRKQLILLLLSFHQPETWMAFTTAEPARSSSRWESIAYRVFWRRSTFGGWRSIGRGPAAWGGRRRHRLLRLWVRPRPDWRWTSI